MPMPMVLGVPSEKYRYS